MNGSKELRNTQLRNAANASHITTSTIKSLSVYRQLVQNASLFPPECTFTKLNFLNGAFRIGFLTLLAGLRKRVSFEKMIAIMRAGIMCVYAFSMYMYVTFLTYSEVSMAEYVLLIGLIMSCEDEFTFCKENTRRHKPLPVIYAQRLLLTLCLHSTL